MNFEIKIPKDKLAEIVGQKLPTISGVCSFCGVVSGREVVGVHWMVVDEDFAYLVSPDPKSQLARALASPKPSISPGQTVQAQAHFAGPAPSQTPGHMACAVVVCSRCGYVSLLSLNQLGILATHRKPNFTLIQGGSNDADSVNDIAGPKGEPGSGGAGQH